MTPATWRRVKDLHAAACALPEGERIAYVEGKLAEDPRAATETLRLLRASSVPGVPIVPLRLPTSGGFGEMSGGGGRAGSGEGGRVRPRLFPGQVLADRYLVRRFIAAGGFGEVYEAEDRERAEIVALKIFRAEVATAGHVSWLRREVQMAQRVRHGNVCRVFDFVSTEGLVFLTMEYLEGETLASILERQGAMTERQALPLVRQIVAGLAAAHGQGVVHRDLKPGNVMVVPRPGGAPRVVLTDFGMAKATQESEAVSRTMTAASTVAMGTPAYMAPEQVTGQAVGKPADIYSLGVVLHEMVTGELPFSGESPLTVAVRKTKEAPPSPRRYAPALRGNWEAAILRCLQPEAKQRFSDVRQVLEELEAGTRGRAWRQRTWRQVRRWAALPRVRMAAMAMVSLAVVVGLGILVLGRPAPEMVARWEQGVMHLQAGEALAALQSWERAGAPSWMGKQPLRAAADRALAWHLVGMPARANAALGEFPAWRASQAERRYAEAVRLVLAGQREAAVRTLATEEEAAGAVADLAFLQSLQAEGASGERGEGLRAEAAASWRKVLAMRPTHTGAMVQLAEEAAATGRSEEAGRYFLQAQTQLAAAGQKEMVGRVNGRRGLWLLREGRAEEARAELMPGTGDQWLAAPTGRGACEHFLVLVQGRKDGFAATPDPEPQLSPRMKAFLGAQSDPKTKGFDVGGPDQFLAASFALPPMRLCSASLEVQMRRNGAVIGSINDGIVLGAAPFDMLQAPPVTQTLWAAYLNDLQRRFTIEVGPEFLAALQRAYAKEPVAYLDVRAGEDTEFDYLQLTLVY